MTEKEGDIWKSSDGDETKKGKGCPSLKKSPWKKGVGFGWKKKKKGVTKNFESSKQKREHSPLLRTQVRWE